MHNNSTSWDENLSWKHPPTILGFRNRHGKAVRPSTFVSTSTGGFFLNWCRKCWNSTIPLIKSWNIFVSNHAENGTIVLEMVKCGANLVSDQKVDFSRNWWRLGRRFQLSFSSRDVDVCTHTTICMYAHTLPYACMHAHYHMYMHVCTHTTIWGWRGRERVNKSEYHHHDHQ